jgi:hypothetical protein
MTKKRAKSKPTWNPALDAVAAASNSHKVLYEDDSVRILDIVLLPGVKEPVHTHQWKSAMIIALPTPRIRYYDDKGKSTDYPACRKKGLSTEGIDPEGPHAVENLGNISYCAIRVEYKI